MDLVARVSAQFQSSKQLQLISQLRSWVQELERRRESSGRFVTALGGELRRFSQTDHWHKKKREPGSAAHVAGVFTKEQPPDTGDGE